MIWSRIRATLFAFGAWSLLFFCLIPQHPAFAVDSPAARKTLFGLKGVYIIAENLQPNIQKFASKFDLTTDKVLQKIAFRLRENGIKVFNKEEWLAATGRPVLYLNINSHEREKYWFAYDIRLELQQVASLETTPSIKALVATWSVNMTGITNVGSLNVLHDNVQSLVDIFIRAYLSENRNH